MLAVPDIDDPEMRDCYQRSLRVFAQVKKRGYDRWLAMFSGGKDSTLLTILLVEYLRSLRGRLPEVDVVYTDSLLEFPQAKAVATDLLSYIEAVTGELPLRVRRFKPKTTDTFWVNIIGRGYTPPRAHFRWCTPRLKINPSREILLEYPAENKAVMTGVRYDESSARKRNLQQSCAKGGECGQDFWMRYGPNGSVAYFAPVVFWRTCKVWDFLTLIAPSMGWPTGPLIRLYGGYALRFGCWTCTLVARDKTAEALIARGDAGDVARLHEFRTFLDEASRDPANRVTHDGQLRGFKQKFREHLLDKLLKLQWETSTIVISEDEIREIRRIWDGEISSR